MNFNGKTTTRKGTLGERIADRHLKEAGYSVYLPSELNEAHPIDRVAICKRSLRVLLLDVKSKPRRIQYPDTGIDLEHWKTYQILGTIHNMRVFLVFIDEDLGEIYGQFLHVLEKRKAVHHNGRVIWYPKTENNGKAEIRYFPICSMNKISNLTTDEQLELHELSTRHKKYEAMRQEPMQKSLF